MQLICTCHGVSGACNFKTCRYSLPEFYTVGDFLHQKYHGAVFVTFDQKRNQLIPKESIVLHQTEDDLVYLENSPDYCVKNLKEGVLGVVGRRCNKTSHGPDGCGILCCGKGSYTKKVGVLTFISYWPFFKISFESRDTCYTAYCATAYFRKKALSQTFDWVLNTLLSSAVNHEERGLVLFDRLYEQSLDWSEVL